MSMDPQATSVVVETATLHETQDIGRVLASLLRAGDLIVLSGPLGAGKTALTQGIGSGLAVSGDVVSPTFVIARVHPPDPARGGTLPLVHVDAYRLHGMLEIDDLDLDTEITSSVTVVEWGVGAVEHLVDEHLRIRIERESQVGQSDVDDTSYVDEPRRIRFEPHGESWHTRIQALSDALSGLGSVTRSAS